VLQSVLDKSFIRDEISLFTNCSDMVDELHAMNKLKLKPDVIFMDMRMPNVNGAECIRILSEVYHQPVAIIAMSADIELSDLSDLDKYIKTSISKMKTPEDLILDISAIVRLHLGKHRPRFIA